jgi:glycosyltransferase involved in cell wall biosynthesis
LPCRNEGNHLKEVVARIPIFVNQVIVVSNKSSDNTVAVARSLGLEVYEDNRTLGGIGYGFAHMTGIAHATGDIIVAADGDATYPIEELDKVVDYLLEHKLDFISCNRYPLQEATHIGWLQQLGIWLLNTEVRALYGIKIQDILSGMWAFDARVKDELNLTMGDWNLSPQIKLNAAINSKIAFAEFSIAQHQRLGTTHQNYLKTGLSHALWIAKNRFGISSATTPDAA